MITDKTNGICIPICGDGILVTELDEKCDDGNTLSGDGCSELCAIEDGYECDSKGCRKIIYPIITIEVLND
jgi:cysteine-rich repeat protein